MRVRLSMGHGLKPITLEVERCRSCEDLVSVATDPLDAHGHCAHCAASSWRTCADCDVGEPCAKCAACPGPREVACADCHVLTREDVLESGLCEACVSDAYERDEQAAEE
jgi:hypothetical protein